MTKSEVRSTEYRARADAATAAAEACVLAHPREQHELAAATWNRMAEAEERRTEEAEARIPVAALALQMAEAPEV
jgi:hypothetical protein